jgi:hypothetical protein
MTHRKLVRLQKQKRRLGYGDYPTRFGVQYKKLMNESEIQTIETFSLLQQKRMKLDFELARTELADG